MHPTHQQPAPAEVDMTPAHVLRDAALYLERHGWTRGLLYADHLAVIPPACAVGAIRYAMFGSPVITATNEQMTQADPIVSVLADYVYDPDNPPPDIDTWASEHPNAVVTDWNDTHGRTADEVIAALRAAADDWDRIHGGAR
jgi:hypothetical protein